MCKEIPCKVGEAALSQDSVAVRSGEVDLSGVSACSHPVTVTGLICQSGSACGVIAQVSV